MSFIQRARLEFRREEAAGRIWGVFVMKVDRKGFTALELIVVVGVVGVLMGLMVPAVMEARDAASRVQCESNLRQIGLALQLYSDAHHGEMPTQLRPALDDYADNEEELWRCPHDHDFTEKNSYAKYYIPRADFPVQDGWQILVRCPRHPNQQGWLHTTVHGLTEFEIPKPEQHYGRRSASCSGARTPVCPTAASSKGRI